MSRIAGSAIKAIKILRRIRLVLLAACMAERDLPGQGASRRNHAIKQSVGSTMHSHDEPGPDGGGMQNLVPPVSAETRALQVGGVPPRRSEIARPPLLRHRDTFAIVGLRPSSDPQAGATPWIGALWPDFQRFSATPAISGRNERSPLPQTCPQVRCRETRPARRLPPPPDQPVRQPAGEY